MFPDDESPKFPSVAPQDASTGCEIRLDHELKKPEVTLSSKIFAYVCKTVQGFTLNNTQPEWSIDYSSSFIIQGDLS